MSTISAPLIHRHLIVRALVADPPRDCAAVHTWLCELCEIIGMHLLSKCNMYLMLTLLINLEAFMLCIDVLTRVSCHIRI